LIDSLNVENFDFVKITKKIIEEVRSGGNSDEFLVAVEIWGDRVKGRYLMATEAVWHIDQHLKKPRHSAIDLMGTMHESFLKHESESRKEMERIIEGAKGIDRRRFENIYDREFFHPGESAR
jgi:hypothetical protein